MKSLAPACIARAIWATSFSFRQMIACGPSPPCIRRSFQEFTTVERRHPAVDENGVRHRKGTNRKRLTHIRGFGDLQVHALENTADDLSDHGGVVHHQDMPHPQTFVHWNND